MRRYEHGGDIFTHAQVNADFSVNLNPLGMPAQVKQAIAAHIDDYSAYPDPQCRALIKALAQKELVPESYLLCGNGAADLIIRLCLATRPKLVVVCAPTFSEYEKSAELSGAKVIYHQLREEEGFQLNERILDTLSAEQDILFLCNPNNPTGALIDQQLLQKIAVKCLALQIVLAVDECFLDFTQGFSVKSLLNEYENIVIFRAFTKLYSMAGLRLGYVISANPKIIAQVTDFGQSWSVSAPAQVAGLAALSVPGWQEKTIEMVARERCFLAAGLTELGLTVFPGAANFILIKSEKLLFASLLARGILIRSCANFPGLDQRYFRLGVKT
ncbi:MAG: threonine-phosphate decarboxylase, partial [Clostridiales bacterium]